MKHFQLNAQKREAFTKAAVKQLRRQGLVPGVLYGHKKENVHFSVVEKDMKDLIYTPNSYIIELNVDGEMHLCMIHDAQYHPVTDILLHLDLLAVNPDELVTINIPVAVSGNSEGVRQGGKLQINARKLRVKGHINDLPDTLNVDVTNLGLGKSIVANDLHFDNLQIVSPKTTIICMVKMTRAAAAASTTAE